MDPIAKTPPNKKRFGVVIIGASGYGAGELVRILSNHPQVEVATAISRSHHGKPLSALHTHLEGICSLKFVEKIDPELLLCYERTAIVISLPTGHAIETISELEALKLPVPPLIIDLSGDLRLKDSEAHLRCYPEVPLAKELRVKSVYALPELGTDKIKSAQIITNPGCLATASILALAPLGQTDAAMHVIIDAKTGTSGAGREPQASMHHPSRAHDCTPYKALEHRHEPEILQALGRTFSAKDSFMFVPHLLPVARGCLISCYITCRDGRSASKLPQRYREFYQGAKFIRLRDRPVRLVDVVGTNFCDVNLVIRGSQVFINTAIDNLGKGMASQCIQNLNILFGLPEETGLMFSALGPV